MVELREHGEALLCFGCARAAALQEGHRALCGAVLGGEGVRLDFVAVEAFDLPRVEGSALADAHAGGAGDRLRGELGIDHDAELEVLFSCDARLESIAEIFGADVRLGLRAPAIPAVRRDPREEVLGELELGFPEEGGPRAAVNFVRDATELARADAGEEPRLVDRGGDRAAQADEDGVVALELLADGDEARDFVVVGVCGGGVLHDRELLLAVREEPLFHFARPRDLVEERAARRVGEGGAGELEVRRSGGRVHAQPS